MRMRSSVGPFSLPTHELYKVLEVFRAFMLFIKLGGFFFRQCSLFLSQYFHAF